MAQLKGGTTVGGYPALHIGNTFNYTLKTRIAGTDNTYANALLHSGFGRPDAAGGSTWIYVDDAGSDSNKFGIYHDQAIDIIDIIGQSVSKFKVNMVTGDVTMSGPSQNTLYMNDIDQGQTRSLHHNSGNIGFLDSTNNWSMRIGDNGILLPSGGYGRTSHENGCLIGGFNNIGDSTTYSNPIYTIGSAYMPGAQSTGNMYGIGYSHSNFFGGNAGTGWGLYVTAAGVTRAIINASNGNIWTSGEVIANGRISASNSAGYFLNDSGVRSWTISATSGIFRITAGDNLGSVNINGNQALHAGNYNSYSPTLTGGNASGTWGINVTGTAGSTGVLTGQAYTNGSDGWFRSTGAHGWFNETYAVGIYANSAGVVKTYNGAEFVVSGQHLYVGSGASSYLHMSDTDDGERMLHCNSNNIGFLSQAGAWGSYCKDDGSWNSDTAIYDNGYRVYSGASRPTTVAGYGITDFVSSGSGNPFNITDIRTNGIYYASSNGSNPNLGGTSDGATYAQFYSSTWGHEIFGDYRTGQIALRGLNNGSWTGWRTVIDSGNYNAYAPSLTGVNASGTWGINITGNSATVGGYAPHQSSGSYTIVQRDVNGYISNNYFYTSGGGSERNASAMGYFAGFSTGDYYIRSYTNAAAAAIIQTAASGSWGINISGDVTKVAGTIGNSTAGQSVSFNGTGGPQIMGDTGRAAMMSFHRAGAYAINFGLDTDNVLRVGGWSMGAVSYTMLHSGNYNSYSPTLTGGNASGTWPIAVSGRSWGGTKFDSVSHSGTFWLENNWNGVYWHISSNHGAGVSVYRAARAETAAVGSGGDTVFWENGQTVNYSYTVSAGKNAMSAGPITINNGVIVTVPNGSTWTVV